MTPTSIAAYLALFFTVSILFLIVHLTIGRLVRPKAPNDEKLAVYECGEPTIGSSFVQFDIRFYVVALLFIIFDVEVAFFFPWATVLGKTNHLRDPALQGQGIVAQQEFITTTRAALAAEMGVPPTDPIVQATAQSRDDLNLLASFAVADILVFFGVLLVGFAYVWKRGDLDWVRALSRQRAIERQLELPLPRPAEDEALVA